MSLDVLQLGASLETGGPSLSLDRAWDRCLQLFALNEEYLVGSSHQLEPTVSLPFVHTARRCYRWH